jgi:hypothetical protein
MNEFDKYKKEYYEIESSKENYNKLKDIFSKILSDFSNIEDEKNDFDVSYNNILNNLKTIKDDIERYSFSAIESKQKDFLEKSKQEK